MSIPETMRVPPNAVPMEKALLCAGLVDCAVVERCDFLEPEHFYSEANAEIWRSFLRLRARGVTPDNVSVRDDLVRVGKLAAIGGDEYLFELNGYLGSANDPVKRASDIVDLAQRRRLISACHEIAAKGYDRSVEHAELMSEAEGLIYAATASRRDEGALKRMDARPIIQRVQDIAEGKVIPMGLSTGVRALDRKIKGLRKKKMYVIAGRPGMGKSSTANCIEKAVSDAGKLAFTFTMEMDDEEHDTRYLSAETGIPGSALESGVIREGDMPKLLRGAQAMDRALVYRDESRGITLAKIRSRVRRCLAENRDRELGVIIIDHVGLLRWSGPRQSGQSREQEVSEYAKALKEMSAEFDCAVVVLAQLNRECEKRPDKRPQLSDLRESGELENSADVVILLYRRGYYAAQLKSGQARKETHDWRGSKRNPDPDEIQAGDDDCKAEFIVAKGRGIATGSVFCVWVPECTRFEDFGGNEYRPEATFRGVPDHVGGDPFDSGDGEPFGDWNP